MGSYALFLGRAFRSIGQVRAYRTSLLPQMVRVGYGSLAIVLAAAVFTGIVMTIQTAYQLENTILGPEAVGAIVVPTLMLELSALITALVMASRVGAGMAAEIGNMRVSEQLDAIEAMGLNSVAYLIIPRIVAGTLMFPVLYVAALALGMVSGAFAGEYLGYLTMTQFMKGAKTWFALFDLVYGLTKSVAFGFIVTSVACWEGYYTSGGAHGVGISTTKSVVTSCVVVLFADYLLAEVML